MAVLRSFLQRMCNSGSGKEQIVMATIKEEAKKLIDRLPNEASWDDLMYQIYVQKKIEMGLKAADSGRLVPHDEVKRKFMHK